MAKPRKSKNRKHAPQAEHRVFPMDLQVGDHIVDAGEWEVVAPPFTTAAGKNAHVRVRKVGQRQFTDLKSWGAHEHVSVKRARAGKGKS